MKILTKSILFAVIIFAVQACIHEGGWNGGSRGRGATDDRADIVLRLRMPGGFAAPKTRSLTYADENTISDVYVLVFDADEKLSDIKQGADVTDKAHSDDNPGQITDPVGGHSGAGAFSVTLPQSTTSGPGASSRLVVLANAEDILHTLGLIDKENPEAASPSVGGSYDGVTAAIHDAITGAMYPSGGTIPMWGETAQIVIALSTSIDITLTRAIARIDVGVGSVPVYNNDTDYPWTWNGLTADGNPIPFQLTSVHVIRANNRYALLPAAGNITAGKVTAPTIPAGTSKFNADITDAAKFEFRDITGGLYTTQDIYIPEADVKVTASGEQGDSNHENRMAIVVGGIYDANGNEKFSDDGTPTFYRLDFASDGDLMNVLRNHLYQFNISNVSGAGHPDVITAYESASMNMTADILEWDEEEMGDIHFIGEHYFGKVDVLDNRLLFSPYGNETIVAKFKTNVENFEMHLDLDADHNETGDMSTDGNGARLKAGDPALSSFTTPFYTYRLARVGATDIYTLTVTSRRINISPAYDFATNYRPEYWLIEAAGMRAPLKVDQSWTSFYISVPNGQELVFFPEGTQYPIYENDELPGIRVASPNDVSVAVASADGTGDTSWFDIEQFPADGLSNPTSGYYMADVAFHMDYYDWTLAGTDRSVWLTFTVNSVPTATYTYKITQQKPFVIVGDGSYPYPIPVTRTPGVDNDNTRVMVGTNIHPDHLSLTRRGNAPEDINYDNERIQLYDAANPFENIDISKPRSQAFRLHVDMQEDPAIPYLLNPNAFSAYFDVSANSLHDYGVPDCTAEVEVGIGMPELYLHWYRATFIGSGETWETEGRYADRSNYIFPWNTEALMYDISINAGIPQDDTTASQLNGGSAFQYEPQLNVSALYRYPYQLSIANANYSGSADDKYTLAYLSSTMPTLKANMPFSISKQRFSALGDDLAIDYKGAGRTYPAMTAAGNPKSKSVTNNVRWKVSVSDISTAGDTSWFGIQVGDSDPTSAQLADYLPHLSSIEKIEHDDRLYAPATSAAELIGSSKAYVSIDALGLNSLAGEGYTRWFELWFENADQNVGTSGLDLSTLTGGDKVRVTQYAPRLTYTSGAPGASAVISAAGQTFSIGTNGNLQWSVVARVVDSAGKVLSSQPSGFPVSVNGGWGGTAAAAAAARSIGIAIPANTTTAARYVSLWLVAPTDFDDTATSTKENEIPIVNGTTSVWRQDAKPMFDIVVNDYDTTAAYTYIKVGSSSALPAGTNGKAEANQTIQLSAVGYQARRSGSGFHTSLNYVNDFIGWMVTSGGVTLSGTVTTLKSGAKLYTDESVTFTMPTRTVTVEAVYTYHTGVKVGNTTWAAYNMQDFNVGVNTAYNMFADAPYTYGSLYQFDRLWGWDPNQKATPQNGNTSISSTAVRRWDNQGPSFNSYDIWYAANNPCPSGWTVPNLTQYSELLDKADYGWHARRTGEVFIVNQSSGRKLAIHFPAGYFFDMTSGNKYSDSAHMTRYITQTRGGYTNGVRNWYSFVFLRPNSPTTAWLDSTVHANAPYIPSDKHTIGAGSALRCVAGAK